MCGEGRSNIVRRKHIARASEIGHIGRRFAGKQGKIGQTTFLRMLDFTVPIRTFHQPNLHDAFG